MAGFLDKARTVVATPAMLAAYARWQVAGLVADTPSLTIAGGRFSGFPRFSSYWGAWVGHPSAAEIRLVRRMCRHGGNVMDIGGNMGVVTVLMAKANPDIIVHALEPAPATAAHLRNNATANGVKNVRLNRLAMSDRVGCVAFPDTDDPATNRMPGRPGDRKTIETATTTMDRCGAENVLIVREDSTQPCDTGQG